MKAQYRQGDVFLARCAMRDRGGLRPVARVRGRVVLAEGELTGHAHAIVATGADLYEDSRRGRYLDVTAPCDLEHEEHAPIALVPGLYRVVVQREYDPDGPRVVRE